MSVRLDEREVDVVEIDATDFMTTVVDITGEESFVQLLELEVDGGIDEIYAKASRISRLPDERRGLR